MKPFWKAVWRMWKKKGRCGAPNSLSMHLLGARLVQGGVQAECNRVRIVRIGKRLGASRCEWCNDASQTVRISKKLDQTAQKQNWHLFCLFRFGNNSSVRCSNEKNETGHGRQRDGGRTHA